MNSIEHSILESMGWKITLVSPMKNNPFKPAEWQWMQFNDNEIVTGIQGDSSWRNTLKVIEESIKLRIE